MSEVVFLYPTSRQFPFDKVCEKIVRELEVRNWNVPDIRVKFYDYGTGEEKYRMVESITGKDFYINFCRGQAAVSEIIIPRKELHVFDDESGPKLYIYVGKNWKKDQIEFFCGTKNMAKYYKRPRTYLVYSGVAYNGRSNILKIDTDIDREYGLKFGDKEFYETNKIFAKFNRWLNKYVLNYILFQPIGEKIEETVELLPVPKEFETLYTLVESGRVAEIKKAKNNLEEVVKSKRFGLIPSLRLVSLDCQRDDSVPEKAYDGFIWCNFDDIFEFRREHSVVKVCLKNINDVYIADLSGSKEYAQSLFEANLNKEYLTDIEYEECKLISGRTLVLLNKYKGGYKEPIILINRELELDEVFCN